MGHGSAAVRRLVVAGAVVAGVWAAVVAATGGFVLAVPWGRLSSRSAGRPLLVGAALAVFYVARWRHRARDDARWVAGVPWAPAVGAAAGLLAVALGIALGSPVAAGPDASGYVSQARLFARGELTLGTPAWALNAPWPNARSSAAPSGYTGSIAPERLAPTYPPGLSLAMAAARRTAGEAAVFLVVPVFGAVAVWGTYLLGRRLVSAAAGALAALLLVSSPAFLALLMQAMSDVPVTACWVLAFCAAVTGRPAAAGAAAAIAIVVRPNLVPLAIVPAALLATPGQAFAGRLVVYALAAVPGALLIALLNHHYFGSPLQSAYGTPRDLFSTATVAPNLAQYGRWLVMTETPLILLWLAAPLLLRRRPIVLLTLAVPALVFALYAPYYQFKPEEWPYLRFLLPAYPGICIGFAAAAVVLWTRSRSIALRACLAVACGVVLYHGWTYAVREAVFDRRRSDQRYLRAAGFMRDTPPSAVAAAVSHSGPVHYYSGRDVLRYEALDGRALEDALAYFDREGRPVYLVGDPFEIDEFAVRYPASAARFNRRRCVDLREALACRLLDGRR